MPTEKEVKQQIQEWLEEFKDVVKDVYLENGFGGLPKDFWDEALSTENIELIANSFIEPLKDQPNFNNRLTYISRFFNYIDPTAIAALAYGESTLGAYPGARSNPLQVHGDLREDLTIKQNAYYRFMTSYLLQNLNLPTGLEGLNQLLDSEDADVNTSKFAASLGVGLIGLFEKFRDLENEGITQHLSADEFKKEVSLLLMDKWHNPDAIYTKLANDLATAKDKAKVLDEYIKGISFRENRNGTEIIHEAPGAYMYALVAQGDLDTYHKFWQAEGLQGSFEEILGYDTINKKVIESLDTSTKEESLEIQTEKVVGTQTKEGETNFKPSSDYISRIAEASAQNYKNLLPQEQKEVDTSAGHYTDKDLYYNVSPEVLKSKTEVKPVITQLFGEQPKIFDENKTKQYVEDLYKKIGNVYPDYFKQTQDVTQNIPKYPTNIDEVLKNFDSSIISADPEETREFWAGFKHGVSLGYIDPSFDINQTSNYYNNGQMLGLITANVGVALLGGAVASFTTGLMRSVPFLAKTLGVPIVGRLITGTIQGGSYLLVNNLLASEEFDLKKEDLPYVFIDFGTGEVARGLVEGLLTRFNTSPVTKQLLSSLSDYVGGGLAAASAEYAKTGDVETFKNNLGPQMLAGFAIENILWGINRSHTLKRLNMDFDDIGAQVESAWKTYVENPTDANWKQVENVLDIFTTKLIEKTGSIEEGDKLFKAIIQERSAEIINLYGEAIGKKYPPEAVRYLTQVVPKEGFDAEKFLHLLKTAENKGETKVEETIPPKNIGEKTQKIVEEKTYEKAAEISQAELEKALDAINLYAIKGLGEKKRLRLIDAIKRGEIKSLDDIDKIPYLGQKVSTEVKEQIKKALTKVRINEQAKITVTQDLAENYLFKYPRDVIIDGKTYKIDIGDKLIDDILKIAQTKDAMEKGIRDPELKKQAMVYLDDFADQIAKQLGINKTEVWKMADEIKSIYNISVTKLKDLTTKNVDVAKAEMEVSNEFIVRINKVFENYLRATEFHRKVNLLLTPEERLKALNLSPTEFNTDIDVDVKEPINLTRILASEPVKKLMYNIADIVDKDIPHKTLAEIEDEAMRIAKTLNFKQDDIETLKKLIVDAPELIVALKEVVVNTSRKAYDLAKQITQEYAEKGEVSPSTLEKFYAALQLIYMFTNDIKNINRSASNILNAGRITVNGETQFLVDIDDPKFLAVFDEVLKAKGIDPKTHGNKALKLAQQIIEQKDLSSVVEVARKQQSMYSKVLRAAIEFRMANILTVSTHVANVVSQALNTGYDITVEATKKLLSTMTGNREINRKATSKLFGILEGLRALFTEPLVTRKELYRAYFNKTPTFWDLLKLRFGNPKLYEKLMRGLDSTTKASMEGFQAALDSDFLGLKSNKPMLRGLIKFMDWAASQLRLWSFGSLSLGDRPFKRIYYEAELRTILTEMKVANPDIDYKALEQRVINYRKAVQLYAGLKSADPTLSHDEIVKRITNIIGENPFKYDDLNIIKEIDARAMEEAKRGTWQDPIESKVLERIEHVVQATPELKFLIPFTHTPTRILEKFLYGTALHKKWWLDVMGKNGPEAKYKAYSSVLVTVSMYLMGYYLYKAGILIPPAINDEEAETMRQYGVEPASIRIGDQFISFTRFDPYPAYVFTAIGALVRIVDELDNLDPEQRTLDRWFEGISNLIAMNFKAITDKTYFRSIGEIIDFLRGEKTTKLFTSVGSSMLPGYGVYKSFRYADIFGFNPFRYDQLTWFREDGKVYPRLNMFGESLEPWGTFLGARKLEFTKDPVEQELFRLYLTKGFKISGFGRTVLGVPIGDKEKYKLYATMGKLNAKQRLLNLIKSENYRHMSDDERVDAINRLWNKIKRAARFELLRDVEFRDLYKRYNSQLNDLSRANLIPFAKLLEKQLDIGLRGQ